MAITITATKVGRYGGPAVEIAFDPGTHLDDILLAQKRIFHDKTLPKQLGFPLCEGCYSGLDLEIKQKDEIVL